MAGSQNLAEGGPRAGNSPPPTDLATGYRIGLKKRAEFQRAGRGRRFNAKALGLQCVLRPDEGEGQARFGLTVTKRVGNAVERNRIKRRFREALRASGVAASRGHDYVIVARREALTVPFAGLVADLAKTLEQARSGRGSGRAGRAAGRPSQSGASA